MKRITSENEFVGKTIAAVSIKSNSLSIVFTDNSFASFETSILVNDVGNKNTTRKGGEYFYMDGALINVYSGS